MVNEFTMPWQAWHRYEERKAQWKAEHPEATTQEYEQAMRAIANELEL